ncbi:hypothetical protein KJ359_004920 [Pestalotiopsis sp. 9143b]|nr:hypothetical protein KJ359_004920 [Pestalotiopsis sp. 9143b]
MAIEPDTRTPQPVTPKNYSVLAGARVALEALAAACHSELPVAFKRHVDQVAFTASTAGTDEVCFPCPLKEQDLGAALKALEGCVAAMIADVRHGSQERPISVDMGKATAFLMSAYLTTLDGMGKGHPKMKYRLPAQSILYRRLSANLYETRIPGEYYHIHGSLEASTTLAMLGLPPSMPGLTDYHECVKFIETAVKKFTISELEHLNQFYKQAGVPVLTKEQFLETPHGQALASIPPFTVRPLGESTPPQPFPQPETADGFEQCLKGVRVLELCRIIAGPVIGRSLAAHGASVLKVTSASLPDVPFFQLDINTGKHTTSLHLKNGSDRAKFEDLLASADVIIDGYRPGVLAYLGYSPESLAAKAAARGRGIVYVAEDCFGGTGVDGAEWASRAGWQQIADCVTGVAWEQGWFMGLDEPVVPPFPISDYGCGILGTVAAMSGLYRRATEGGSWICRSSISQYDLFLLSLGTHSFETQQQLWEGHDRAIFDLRHSDSVDEISGRALRSMKRLHPALFSDEMMQSALSPGFAGRVRWPREPLSVGGLKIAHTRPARPNGYDTPTWEGWEQNEIGADA